jgi:hypothetical protein
VRSSTTEVRDLVFFLLDDFQIRMRVDRLLRLSAFLSVVGFSAGSSIKLNNGVIMPQIAAGAACNEPAAAEDLDTPFGRHVAVRQRDRHQLHQASVCRRLSPHRHG